MELYQAECPETDMAEMFWYWARACQLTVSEALAEEAGLKAGTTPVKKAKMMDDLKKGVLKEVEESDPKAMRLECGEDLKFVKPSLSCEVSLQGKKTRVVSANVIAKELKEGKLEEMNHEGKSDRYKVTCPNRTFWVIKVKGEGQ